mgnify:FL=1
MTSGLVGANEETLQKALEVYRVLVRTYGERPYRQHHEAVDELVLTILSQNTSDLNSGRAFANLREVYPSWEDVLAAPPDRLAEAIRAGGLAQIKAPRIQAALQRILAERGAFELEFLRRMPVAEAKAWLTGLDGVGAKTAACVLLFGLGIPAFPVDTHVHRVTRRLGIAPAKASPEQVSAWFEALLPAELYYPYHVLVIQHGRELCKAQRPRCEMCPLSILCDFFQAPAA